MPLSLGLNKNSVSLCCMFHLSSIPDLTTKIISGEKCIMEFFLLLSLNNSRNLSSNTLIKLTHLRREMKFYKLLSHMHVPEFIPINCKLVGFDSNPDETKDRHH